jgi:hypothetical protein
VEAVLVKTTNSLLLGKVAAKSNSKFWDQVTKERHRWDEMLDKQADPARSKDRKASVLGRETFFGFGKSEIVQHQVHQVGGIFAVMDGELAIEPNMLGYSRRNRARRWRETSRREFLKIGYQACIDQHAIEAARFGSIGAAVK